MLCEQSMVCGSFLRIHAVMTGIPLWMQTYLQSLTVRLEEMRVKRQDTEQWMRHRNLPHHIVQRVRRYDQYKGVATRGVDEEMLVQSLPTDLRRDIKRHLCLRLVRNVSSSLVCMKHLLTYPCFTSS